MVVMGESRSCEGIAGGGRMSGVSSEARRGFSWLLMSVEATGVGGRVGRGMVGCVDERVLPKNAHTRAQFNTGQCNQPQIREGIR